MKKYNRNSIGQTAISNEGYTMTVIDGGDKSANLTISIGSHYTKEVCAANFRNGLIKFPYKPTHSGVGYMGESLTPIHRKSKSVWKGMLDRCYSKDCENRNPTYLDVTVCDEWLNYSVFKSWYIANHVNGWHMDKDLLDNTARVYSPSTCVFLPREVNNFLVVKPRSSSDPKMMGVEERSGNYRVQISIKNKTTTVGTFSTLEEARSAYRKAKMMRTIEFVYKYPNMTAEAKKALLLLS